MTTKTAQFTPGPIHNDQPCTCYILLRTGEPLESSHGAQPCANISRIELCPMHAAAPAMYEALSELVKYLREEVADEALDTWEPVFKAAMVLAQAEGRQA